jgi:hypothetical protein
VAVRGEDKEVAEVHFDAYKVNKILLGAMELQPV